MFGAFFAVEILARQQEQIHFDSLTPEQKDWELRLRKVKAMEASARAQQDLANEAKRKNDRWPF